MSVLMLDNYDSFTYNLVQYMAELGAEVWVHRNDQLSLADITALAPSHIVVSPGPGTPDTAGISISAIAHFAGQIPILGVCLGMQAIGQVFGGKVVRAGKVMHGKTSAIIHDGSGVFTGIPSPYTATRYHSLVLAKDSLPTALSVSAWTLDEQGQVEEIMAVRHKELAVEGVQFHPESLASEYGHALLKNFLQTGE